MRVKLTDRTVQQLVPPAQGRVEVFDAKTPGLAVRVSAGGRKTWTFVWHRNGRVHRLALGTYQAVGLVSAREQTCQKRAARPAGRRSDC
jgi:Arm domain-containing DNA-binding protein